MIVYKNSYTDEEGNHAGYEFFTSKAEADRVWVARHRSGSVINSEHSYRALKVRIDTRKKSLVHFLNVEASYPASGHWPEAFNPEDLSS
tara:strand:- start:10611 stop:10877 length:267 start_codon:yes stop_codon:yes gene_type:complete